MELTKPTAEAIALANAMITDALLDEMRVSGFGPQVEALRVLRAATMPLTDAGLAANFKGCEHVALAAAFFGGTRR